uniref:AlNc14C104G6163 protein n=1 Tax=Albugo laibachii Nc14 TaxID=890382 RepID=F0WHV6_9STRA|nr:AlNc14C104G6163 [Albugo laibachii Nc14]|eukprot:CCA20831.1 AlNc14C104G6163 [Albugo laibachii Nc14]
MLPEQVRLEDQDPLGRGLYTKSQSCPVDKKRLRDSKRDRVKSIKAWVTRHPIFYIFKCQRCKDKDSKSIAPL